MEVISKRERLHNAILDYVRENYGKRIGLGCITSEIKEKLNTSYTAREIAGQLRQALMKRFLIFKRCPKGGIEYIFIKK